MAANPPLSDVGTHVPLQILHPPCTDGELTLPENGLIYHDASPHFAPSVDGVVGSSHPLGRPEMSLGLPHFGDNAPRTDGLEILIQVDRKEVEEGFEDDLPDSLHGVEVSVQLGDSDTTGAEHVLMNEVEGQRVEDMRKLSEFDTRSVEDAQKNQVGAEGREKKRPRDEPEETCRLPKPRKIIDGTESSEVREQKTGGLGDDNRGSKEAAEMFQTAVQPEASQECFQSSGESVIQTKSACEKQTTDILASPASIDQVEISRQVEPKLEELPNGGLHGANRASDTKFLSGVESEGDCMDEAVETKEDLKETDRVGALRTRPKKRRKIAMLFAYCGAGYQGMQKNPGAVTIEGVLEEALLRAEALPQSYDGNPRKVDWMRAARTDKGVSAVGQVVSGFFFVDPPGFVERVNSYLPSQIRLLGYKRVTPTFSAKKYCDRRRYEYVIPIFAVDPSAHRDRETVLASEGREGAFAKCLECSERGRKVPGAVGKGGCGSGDIENQKEVGSHMKVEGETSEVNKESSACSETFINNGASEIVGIGFTQKITGAEVVTAVSDAKENQPAFPLKADGNSVLSLQEHAVSGSQENNNTDLKSDSHGVGNTLSSFHFGEAERTRLNRILNRFVGTHNFHNFTTRLKADDPSAKRFIVSFEAGDVFTVGNTEFVKCVVVGQSFMLHQIRKMIGLAIAIFRGCVPESMMDTALRRDVRVTVPTAPELGLFLDECMYFAYNQKWHSTHEEVSQKGLENEISDFKHNIIYKHIAATKHKEGLMALFLHSLNDRNFPDFVTAREAEKLKEN